MEGNRRNFLNKHSNPHFKRTGGSGRSRHHKSDRDEFYENSHPSQPSETVYCILCNSTKIGSVIGRGGSIIKTLREDTQARITVSDPVQGSDERVITIFSPSDRRARRERGNNGDEAVKGYDAMEPHCAAQHALLKVHDRIAEEELHLKEKSGETAVTARLLVSNYMVGCILGRRGDVIQRLRSGTGANIRVLTADHLPSCAASNDELVQISGEPATVKKALYEISSLLHQNPRRDEPVLHLPSPRASRFDRPGPPLRHNVPLDDFPWMEHTVDTRRMEVLPFKEEYGSRVSTFGTEDFDDLPSHEREAPSEFVMKILCIPDKIGSVIGKGGSTVRQLEKETGASIHVEGASKDTDEKVIHVSSVEALCDRRSPTIDAILHLQHKTSKFSDKGIITRLLVSSNKVGCLLGQGGHIINDMRRRTQADIRVISNEEKPKCALHDEELVEISGNFEFAKDALQEVASRLRERFLRDTKTRGEPAPTRTHPGLGSNRNLRDDNFPLSSTARGGNVGLGRYEHLQGSASEFEPPSFPASRHVTGYLDVDEAMPKYSLLETQGSHLAQFPGTRARFPGDDPYSTTSDFGSSELFSSSRNMYRTASPLPAGPNNYPRPGAYESYDPHQGTYRDNTASSPGRYQHPAPWPSPSYRNAYMDRDPYESIGARGTYQYK